MRKGTGDSARWRVWAPRAKQVELVLIDGTAQRSRQMSAEEPGYFSHVEAGVPEGQRYAYRLDGGPERPDPASPWQPAGIHQPSAVLRPERFSWTDQHWSGVSRADLVIYELHVGAFTPEGTFEAVIPRLPILKDLGITALELMPVAQFPGGRNWGYDGVHLYAPQNTYGGPHGLQRLVDACHAQGLAILLDVVYNHLGPEGNYLNEFGPYYSDHYRTPWGPALNYDAAGSDAVRDFILNNVRYWIGAYHCDGLRLDAAHKLYDSGPRHILHDVKSAAAETALALGRRVHVIAETSQNHVRFLDTPERNGYGLDAQWHDDFHHAVHATLTGERQGYYADFGPARVFPKLLERTFLFDGQYSRYWGRRHGSPAGALSGDRFVVYLQNHDQVGNRAHGDRLATLLGPPAQRLAASLLLLAPHLPLLFMGEEYAEDRPFHFFCSFLDPKLAPKVRQGRKKEFAAFNWQEDPPNPEDEATFLDSRLSWTWPEKTHREGLRRLYQDLLAARKTWPALKDFTHRKARFVPQDGPVLQLIRGETDRRLHIYFNLAEQPFPLKVQPADGCVLFSSEAPIYGGGRKDHESVRDMFAHECLVFGPAACPTLCGESTLGKNS